MMSKHDRQYETVTADGQIIVHEGPTEIASWFFPHEPEEDELRAALRKAIEELLTRGEMIGERVGSEVPETEAG
jgi:hypothetical protein